MARANDASVAAEDKTLVSVRLLRDYVPAEAVPTIPADDPSTKIYTKEKAGSVLDLPRDEARAAIAAGIAKIDADLV